MRSSRKIEAGKRIFYTPPHPDDGGAVSFWYPRPNCSLGELSVTAVLANQRSQKQNISSQGGAAVTSYSFKADDYEENRHSCSRSISATLQ